MKIKHQQNAIWTMTPPVTQYSATPDEREFQLARRLYRRIFKTSISPEYAVKKDVIFGGKYELVYTGLKSSPVFAALLAVQKELTEQLEINCEFEWLDLYNNDALATCVMSIKGTDCISLEALQEITDYYMVKIGGYDYE